MSNSERPRRPSPVEQRWATRQNQRRSRSGWAGLSGGLTNGIPLNVLVLAGLAILVAVLLAGMLLGGGTESRAPVRTPAAGLGSGTGAGAGAGASAPAPTAPATAAPVQQRARIINLGDALGQLRETPNFRAPPLQPIFKDGDEVIMLGPEKVVDNLRWRLILVSDSAGWVPETNLELVK